MSVVSRAFLALFVLATSAAAQDMRFFSIGSGNIDGGYYAAARAICGTVNRRGSDVRCSPEPTTGSLYNLAALRDGQIDFALVQSDWHRIAYEGTDLFSELGPMTEMRSVMSLYPESVTVLAHRNSGIRSPADLLGKRIDIGHQTSGRHATIRRLLEALGTSEGDFAAVSTLSDAAALDELCADRIDAVVLIVGHPNASVARVLQDCDVYMAQFTGPRIDAALVGSTDYVRSTVQRGTYPDLNYSVQTYAVTATLVTRADTAPGLVEEVVGRTLASLERLRAETPLFARVDFRGMTSRGLTAPLHPAAVAAFDAFFEAGAPTQ